MAAARVWACSNICSLRRMLTPQSRVVAVPLKLHARMPTAGKLHIISTESRKPLATSTALRAANDAYETGQYSEQYPTQVRKIRPGVTYYKGKAGALNFVVITPTWEKKAESATSRGGYLNLARPGTLLLEFAQSVGDKAYDWENKGVFSLSTVELAGLVEYPNEEHNFLHDPGMLSETQGQVRKNFSVKPQELKGQPGWYFSLQVTLQGAQPKRYGIPVSKAEMAELKILAHRFIPIMRGLEDPPFQRLVTEEAM